MTEPTPPEGGTDFFDEGFEAGQDSVEDELRDKLADQLEDEGFDPDEIDELIYDPAPRRRRGGRRRRSRRRTYDPATRRRRKSRRAPARRAPATRTKTYARRTKHKRGGKKKGRTLKKLEKWAFPVSTGISFFGLYWKRAHELFDLGLISSANDVFGAIMYDFKNFSVNDMFTRLTTQALDYGLPFIGGYIIDSTKVLGKHSKVGSQALYGIGTGMLAKTVLDPVGAAPTRTHRTTGRSSGVGTVKVVSTGNQTNRPCPGCNGGTVNNPYS